MYCNCCFPGYDVINFETNHVLSPPGSLLVNLDQVEPVIFCGLICNKVNVVRIKTLAGTFSLKPSPRLPCVRLTLSVQVHFWCWSVMVISTAQPHSTESGLDFCVCSNPAPDVSKVSNNEKILNPVSFNSLICWWKLSGTHIPYR